MRLADANAKAVAGEAVAQADIAAAQATLAVKKAEAYQLAETKKREAEAAVLEAQNRAMAKAALAEAEKIEAEKRAVLEAPAKAEKAKMIVDAEAAAERVKLEAQAQAATIYAKLEAEARGQYEILAKKGEGLKKIIEACGSAQAAFQLLMLEHMDALAEASAKAISNIKFDKVVVWEGGGANGHVEHRRLPQGHGPDDAADAPGDEGRRRRRGAGVPRQADRRRAAGGRQGRAGEHRTAPSPRPSGARATGRCEKLRSAGVCPGRHRLLQQIGRDEPGRSL